MKIQEIYGVRHFWNFDQLSWIIVDRTPQLSGIIHSAEHEEILGRKIQFLLS